MKDSKNEILFKKFSVIKCYKKDEHSAVYLANQIFLDKKVFLKVLNIKSIPDQSINERFKREAKILAQLEHPNIINVFDFGMFHDYFYISFEYFESKNLRELLNSKIINDEIKLKILIQIVKGLEYAHSKNVIHRDIKPENILVDENYFVKLTDFGLAQLTDENIVTKRYAVVGTPAYMSPEQIQGDNLTTQSDLFSLGITTFELFSGKNLFIGENANETINNIISFDVNENPKLFTTFSNDIKEVIIGLLSTGPADRFKSCKEVLKILKIDHVQINKKNNRIKRKIIYTVLFTVIVIISLIFFSFEQDEQTNNEPVNSIKKEDQSSTEKSTNETPLLKSDKILIHEEISDNNSDLETNNNENIIPDTLQKSNNMVKNSSFGNLFVKCYPWAKVYLNEKYIETTPLNNNINIKSGLHFLKLVHPDYPEYSDSIIIQPNELFFVEVNLDTLFGYFDCQIYPWGEIYIDGKKMGMTPLEDPIKLKEGKYNLQIRNPKYKTQKTLIHITKSETLSTKFNLKESTN